MSSHKIALFLVAVLAVQVAFAAKNVKNLRTNQKISIISDNDEQSTDLIQFQDFIDNLRSTSSNKFNQQVLETIMLKIKSGDNYDSLIQLLSTITNQLQIDQQADDQNCITQSGFINGQISDSQTNLAEIQNKQVDLGQQLADEQVHISDLNSQIAVVQDKLDKVNAFSSSLETARTFDAGNFASRIQEQNAILSVIGEITSQLGNAIEQQINSGAADQSALVQLQNKMESLKSLGTVASKDVISNMVQLTMTFDVAQVQQIVSLLNQIQDAINQSIVQDQNDETQAIADYQQMTIDIAAVQDALNSQLTSLNQELSSANINVQNLQDQIAANQVMIQNINTTLVQLNEQLTNLTNQYQQDKDGREQTLDTVNTVSGKIGSIQSTIQSYS